MTPTETIALLRAMHEAATPELLDCLKTIKQFRRMDIDRGGGSTATEDRIARVLPNVLDALPALLDVAAAALIVATDVPDWAAGPRLDELRAALAKLGTL